MAALKQEQKRKTKSAIEKKTKSMTYAESIPTPPLLVTITRIGPVNLDDDNLSGACKYVRDQIAAAVGVDDGSPLYTWRYEQRRGEYGVDVEITSR